MMFDSKGVDLVKIASHVHAVDRHDPARSRARSEDAVNCYMLCASVFPRAPAPRAPRWAWNLCVSTSLGEKAAGTGFGRGSHRRAVRQAVQKGKWPGDWQRARLYRRVRTHATRAQYRWKGAVARYQQAWGCPLEKAPGVWGTGCAATRRGSRRRSQSVVEGADGAQRAEKPGRESSVKPRPRTTGRRQQSGPSQAHPTTSPESRQRASMRHRLWRQVRRVQQGKPAMTPRWL